MNIPDNLKYTKDHEWIKIDGNTAIVGVTDYAQNELGDIVFVEINSLDQELGAEEVFGTVEAVKTVSDLFMPLAGKVTEVNESLESTPESINQDPYGAGWIIKMTLSNPEDAAQLLDAAAYKELVS